MRILHISDWHGQMHHIESIIDYEYDMVVCSGDLLPNRTRGLIEVEKPHQAKWVKSMYPRFEQLIGNRPFVFCAGNHDYVDPCEILNGQDPYTFEPRFNAINASYKLVEVNGIRFYGLPAVPYMKGEWNHEAMPGEMTDFCNTMLESFPVDVLITHCPLYGYLDSVSDGRAGNSVLTNSLYYGDFEWPKLILSGHLHEANGMLDLGECKLSNASCGFRILEI